MQGFRGTAQYEAHKQKRFPKPDLQLPIPENEAFLLSGPENHADFTNRYEATKNLYYQGQPLFGNVLARIRDNLKRL